MWYGNKTAMNFAIYILPWASLFSILCWHRQWPSTELRASEGGSLRKPRQLWQTPLYHVCTGHIFLLNYSIKPDNENSLTQLSTQVNKGFTLKCRNFWSLLHVNKWWFSLPSPREEEAFEEVNWSGACWRLLLAGLQGDERWRQFPGFVWVINLFRINVINFKR